MNCVRSLHFIGVWNTQNCILSEFRMPKTAFYRSLQGSNLHFIGVCGNRTTLQRVFCEQAFNTNETEVIASPRMGLQTRYNVQTIRHGKRP